MVEENTITGKHVVRLTIVDHDPVSIEFGTRCNKPAIFFTALQSMHSLSLNLIFLSNLVTSLYAAGVKLQMFLRI